MVVVVGFCDLPVACRRSQCPQLPTHHQEFAHICLSTVAQNCLYVHFNFNDSVC